MKKLLFTVLVAVVAIGGSLSIDASVKRTPIPGSLFNSNAPCNQSDNTCDPDGTFDCVNSSSQQLYGADANGKCTVPLQRI